MDDQIKGGISLARPDHLDAILDGYIAKTRIPGIVTMIYRKGNLVHHRACGLLGKNLQKPMPPRWNFPDLFNDQTHYLRSALDAL